MGFETRLSDGWLFSRDHKTWESVSVPHDWAIGGAFCETNDLQITRIVQDGEVCERRHTGRTGALPWPGRGWYRRELCIPKGAEYAELVFDGAMSEPVVSADGVEVGRWMNGYNSFIVKIPVSTRMVEVALNNPSSSSRWYPGSGLIRPVRLVTGGKVGIATWGNWIRTTELAADAASVAVTTRIRGASDKYDVEWTLRKPDGEIAAQASASVSDVEVSCLLRVPSPQLWSPESPALYQLETKLKKDAVLLDERRDRIGIRTAGFTREGFFLNGKKRPFRGVCLHHDLGPLGAAFNKSAFRRQIRLLKEIGVDSIRTSHNMPTPDQMDICDEEGIMVMAESFDMWMTPKTPNDYSRHFKEWWRRDLENLLLCHRSHPSIVMWSIGNEIREKDSAAARDIAEKMTEMCHRMDPTRPVVFVTDRPDAYTASGVIQVTDVPALTYRLPRYGFMHEHSPIGLVLGGETASTFSSRGCYHFPDEVGVNAEHADGQSSSYDLEHGSWSNLPDDDWAMQDDHPWAIGEFVWTGFDYLGEPTPYKTYWPSRSSYFGLFDLAGLPKDRAWLYRSRWRRDSPTLHVLPHWTWPGREGKVTPVYVYTSYPEAELFVNGVSQGRRRRDRSSRLDRYRLRWRNVVYEPGELKVVAYGHDGRAAAEKTVCTADKPVELRIEPEQGSLGADELGWFRVKVVDRHGNVCPCAENRIDVKVSGAAAFQGICNGDATSLEPFTKPTMKAFNGELVVTVRPVCSNGVCIVEANSPGLACARCEISVGSSAVCASTAARGEDTVVQRFGFEKGEELAGSKPSSDRFSFVDGVGEASSRALVWNGPDIREGAENFAFPSFPAEPGREYHYRIKARCDGDIVGRVYVHMRYSTGSRIEAFEGRPIVNNKWKKGGKWVEISGGTTMLPPDAKSGSVSVTIRSKTTGRMIFDNLEVTATPRRYIRFLQSSAYRDCAVGGTVRFVAPYIMAQSECPLEKRRPEFIVKGPDGAERRIAAQEVQADWFAGSCAVEELALGSHPVVARIADADGKEFDRLSIDFTRAEKLPQRKVYFDEHQRLIVNGKPFFALGMSGCGTNDAETAIYADSAFNCTYTGNKDAFRRAAARGLKVIVGASSLAAQGEKGVAKACREWADNDNMLVWCTNDELPPGFAARQTTLYKRLRKYDPDHPVYAVLDKHYHVRDFMPSFDFIIMDPYPVGNRRRGTIAMCTEWAVKAREAVFGMRPVWQEPQAFDWEWHRRNFNASSPEHHFPTRDEFRSMAWQPLALGVKGFIWYSFDWMLHASSPEEFKERWGYVRETVAEIARFSPVFLSVEPVSAAKSNNAAVTAKTWRHEDFVWLAAVNTTDRNQRADISVEGTVERRSALAEIGSMPEIKDPTLFLTFRHWALRSCVGVMPEIESEDADA